MSASIRNFYLSSHRVAEVLRFHNYFAAAFFLNAGHELLKMKHRLPTLFLLSIVKITALRLAYTLLSYPFRLSSNSSMQFGSSEHNQGKGIQGVQAATTVLRVGPGIGAPAQELSLPGASDLANNRYAG